MRQQPSRSERARPDRLSPSQMMELMRFDPGPSDPFASSKLAVVRIICRFLKDGDIVGARARWAELEKEKGCAA